MTDDAGANLGRHILEPLEQAASLLGAIPEPEIAVPGRAGRRDARGRPRLGVCLAVSLALHALVLAMVPVPDFGERGATVSAVRVSLSFGTVASDRETAGSPPPSAPGVQPTAPSSNAQADSPSATPEDPLPRPRETESAGGEPNDPGTAVSQAVPGPSSPDSESGPVGAGHTSPSDQTAALLRARVEAALVYPEAARRRGTEGVVGLRIFLDGSGALADLKLTRSSGSALLDRAARETVAACLPVPNPSATPLAFELAVRFALKKTAAP